MATEALPDTIQTEEQLEELLSRPTPAVIDLFKRMQGDLAIVGGAGKIGPSLTNMALRARQAAGTKQDIIVISRFRDRAVREQVEAAGARTVCCDMLDDQAVAALPDAANVVFMVGTKFGTSNRPDLTWATNGVVPAYFARRYKDSRIVAFSTGCVYNFVDFNSGGSVETDPLDPPGEYANSCVARERILQYFSNTLGTKMLQLRLNYAVELRYGVLVDLANKIAAGQPIDLTMGYVNVIWQGDVNAATLRLLEHVGSPAVAMNLTGHECLAIRDLATELGRLMDEKVHFTGVEAKTALLSNSAKSCELLGKPEVPISRVLRWVAQWTRQGGKTLGKPTHFETSDGRY